MHSSNVIVGSNVLWSLACYRIDIENDWGGKIDMTTESGLSMIYDCVVIWMGFWVKLIADGESKIPFLICYVC